MKKSIKKIASALIASVIVVSSIATVSFAKPTTWSVGVEQQNEAIETYTVSQANNKPTFEVPVKVFNNANLNNYTFYVNYDPSELMVVGATEGQFSMSSIDLTNKSLNHTPADGNPSFAGKGANGVLNETELGRIKFAYSADVAETAAKTDAEITLFTLKFQVVKTNPQAGDKYWITFTTDDKGNALYSDDLSTTSNNFSDGYVLITSNGSNGGGGGGGRPAITTTETTTVSEGNVEATTSESVVRPSLNKEDHFAYVVGYPNGNVRPNGQITRAEVASIYFRLLAETDREKFYTNTNDFSDVQANLWFNIAVSSMTDAEIVHGYPNGTFQGNKPITRAEFATIAAQFDNGSYTGADKFPDINGHWAAKYINAAAELGWIHGYEDGTFKPNQNITRAEAMTLINSMLNRQVSVDGLLDDMNKWADNMNQDAWYYTIVQEATNSHFHTRPDGVVEDWTAMREAPDWASIERPGSVYKVLVGNTAVETPVVETEEATEETSEEATEETTEAVETTTEAVIEE